MTAWFKNFLADAKGSNAIEYCMIAFLISVIAITAMTSIGVSTNTMTTSVIAGFR
jgi:Flp pilus assembly pilin Flp